jgi:hypothetical protein
MLCFLDHLHSTLPSELMGLVLQEIRLALPAALPELTHMSGNSRPTLKRSARSQAANALDLDHLRPLLPSHQAPQSIALPISLSTLEPVQLLT